MTRLERDRAAVLAASIASQAKEKRENAKTSHTPGPWAAGRKTISGLNHRVYAKDAILIADCDGQQGYTSALADARLIAAAPDLLEALQEMVAGDAEAIEEAQALGVPFPEEMLAVFKKASAAIARATGDAP